MPPSEGEISYLGVVPPTFEFCLPLAAKVAPDGPE